MKVIEEHHQVEQSGALIEVQAAIKATSKAFHVLSNHLYSDKILAIVRELSCNAWDSHVSAGKRDVPIEIHLPTSLSANFYVKDFGLGMSDFDVRGGYIAPDGTKVSHEQGHAQIGYEQFHGVYTTFFDSTKTNSNDVIGQLGLGSKSPYAYAHTFTVESRFDGVKRLYACYKNSNNEPAISLMSTSDTDECNGMTVSMAVRSGDARLFAVAAQKALMYFKPQPKVTGQNWFAPYKLEHTVSGTDWKIRQSEYSAYMNGAYVVQGFVPYPVDVEQLKLSGQLSTIATSLASASIDLYVPIGDVEVAPSREALSYDQRTIANVAAALERAASEIRKSFEQEIDQATTYWNAVQVVQRLAHDKNQQLASVFSKLDKQQPFKWNDTPLLSTLKLNLAGITKTTITIAHPLDTTRVHRLHIDGTWNTNKGPNVFEFAPTRNMHVVVDPKGIRTNSKIAAWLKAKGRIGNVSPSVLLIRPTDHNAYDQAEVQKIIDLLGHPNVTYVDAIADLPKAVRAPSQTATQRRASGVALRWIGFHTKAVGTGRWYRREMINRTFSRSVWCAESITMHDGGFYVDVDKHTVLTPSGSPYVEFDILLTAARAFGILSSDDNVYGFSKRESANADKTVWLNLFDFIGDQFKRDFIDSGALDRAKRQSNLKLALPSEYVSFATHATSIVDKLVDGPLKSALRAVHDELSKPIQQYDGDHASRLMALRSDVVAGENSYDKMVALSQQLVAALSETNYPFMRLVALDKVNTSTIEMFVNMVNQVDSLKEEQANG